LFEALKEILSDHFAYRRQLLPLAAIELRKNYQGSVLGWIWLFVKPLTYIFVFWFALDIGLRQGADTNNGIPYIIWLTAGIIPWFYMRFMIVTGSRVYSKYSYLVTKIRFPISVVPTFVGLSEVILHICLLVLLFVMYFATGCAATVYMLQVPILLLLMILFFVSWGLFSSLLTAISRDFGELVKALVTPAFWLSGIIFDMSSVNSAFIQTIMSFNPIAYFARAYRMAFVDQTWFWNDWSSFGPFLVCLVGQILLALWAYKKCKTEVADVL
jgi:teichoic acid transport system permease protein